MDEKSQRSGISNLPLTQSVIIQFHFCPTPLNKTSIVKINVSIQDKFLLKDAMIKAIKVFNKQSTSLKLVEISEKYKIKLSKKSGLPDVDLPAINENMKISEGNFLNFSIPIENEHIQVISQKNFLNANTDGPFKDLNETFINEKNSRNPLYVDSDDSVTVRRTSCCGNFLVNFKNLFSKKK